MVRSSISRFKRRLVFVCVAPLLFLGTCQTFVFGGKALVEKTGQITSYSVTDGEDGDLKKGVAWPSPRFTDKSNGTVKDNLTKLIWLKNATAFGVRTWEEALADANALASGSSGLTDGSKAGDWRLPNVKELQSLIDDAYYGPALSSASGTSQWSEGNPFSGVSSNYWGNRYWSSTTYSGATTVACTMNLYDGSVSMFDNGVYGDSKTNAYYVWPVRAGK